MSGDDHAPDTIARGEVIPGGALMGTDDVDDVDGGSSDGPGSVWRRLAWLVAGVAVLLSLLVMLGPNFQFPVLTHRPADPPAVLTDEDGTTYTLLGTASVQTWHHKELTVAVTPDPAASVIRVWAACALASGVGKWKRSTMALRNSAAMPGVDPGSPLVFTCSAAGQTSDVEVRTLPQDGAATRLTFQNWDTTADTPTRWPATWVFGVYQRGIPTTSADTPKLNVTMPAVMVPDWASGHQYTLLQQASGNYPQQKSVAVAVPPGHLFVAVANACSTVLQNIPVLYLSIGASPAGSVNDGNRCGDGTAARLNSPVLVKLTPAQVASGVTLVVTVKPPTAYVDRSAAWVIGVYLG